MLLRNELKFIAVWPLNYQIPEIIKLNPGLFSEIYNSRFINNIYFDSLDFKAYNDTINGVSRRKKFRIRWYGDFFGLINDPMLEMKEKEGKVVRKTSHPFPPFELKSSMNIKDILNNNSDSDCNHLINTKKPSIINRYQRKYFLSKDGRFRLTIDTNQKFSNPKNIQNPKNINQTGPPPTIIELKYDIQWEKEAIQVTNALPFRLNKNSKYINTLKVLYDIP
jgi:hypothetical protein